MTDLNIDAVTISLRRYEQLIDVETRVNVVVERIARNGYIATQDLLWILGTELSVELAQELRDKEESERKEYAEKYGREESEVE